MLNEVVKVYKDTPTAKEAKAALDRAEKNLPLFATGPIVRCRGREGGSCPGRAAAAGRRRRRAERESAGQGPGRTGAAGQPLRGGRGPAAGCQPDEPRAAAATAGRPLPPGFQANLHAGVHASGWPLVIVGDRDGAADGPRSGRHIHDGQRRGPAGGKAGSLGPALDLLHRPARSDEPPVPRVPRREPLSRPAAPGNG